jgi:ADP-ribose pyrophosphatase
VVGKDGKPVLEFVAVKRKDTGEWALPGGMVDAGDTVSLTLKKEFGEEALNSLEATEERKKEMAGLLKELFKDGQKLYAGYVDDPRNTDNAWMETVAINFHDDTGGICDHIQLEAGDDAGAVKWTEVTSLARLYASHLSFISKAAEIRGAAW